MRSYKLRKKFTQGGQVACCYMPSVSQHAHRRFNILEVTERNVTLESQHDGSIFVGQLVVDDNQEYTHIQQQSTYEKVYRGTSTKYLVHPVEEEQCF